MGGSVSVAVSDSRSSRAEQLRFPAGGTDRSRSKTEQKGRRRSTSTEERAVNRDGGVETIVVVCFLAGRTLLGVFGPEEERIFSSGLLRL